jgi:hypothetical protein
MAATLKGADALQKQLAALARTAPGVGAAAARALAEGILARSNELVPVDSGELRDSGEVIATDGGFAVTYSAPYALTVHEDTSARHPHGGQAKFLEVATMQVEADAAHIAGPAANAALKAGR